MEDIFNRNDTISGICNSALAAIGETRFIDDVSSDNNQLAKIIRVVFYQVCREVQGHEYAAWSELAADSRLVLRDAESLGGTFKGCYQYNLPLHMIAPVECYTESGERVPFEIVGGYLQCKSGSGVILRYIRFSFEPSEWSVELQTCIIKLLSARLMASVVKEFTASQRMEQQFWNYEYPYWVGNKKNKTRQTTVRGNDSEVTGNYPAECGGMVDIY